MNLNLFLLQSQFELMILFRIGLRLDQKLLVFHLPLTDLNGLLDIDVFLNDVDVLFDMHIFATFIRVAAG